MKSYTRFLEITRWCKTHPEMIAGIVTPEGVYTISFKPVSSVKPDDNNQWIRKYFDEEVKQD